MPAKQHIFGQRLAEGSIQVNHHLRDASLGRPNAPSVRRKAQLLAEGRLHTRAVQNLAFDFGSRDRFCAHRLNRELIALFLPQMSNGAVSASAFPFWQAAFVASESLRGNGRRNRQRGI